MSWRDRGIEIKTPEQVAAMRRAGLVVGGTLEVLRAAVRPGVTTAAAGRHRRGRHPHRRGDTVVPRLPAASPPRICTSVNDEVVHGIPGERVLREGDLVSIDCGAIVDGWHGDAAITVPVGDVPEDLLTLVDDTEAALWAGIAAARAGGRVGDISAAVEGTAARGGPLRDPRGLHRPRHRYGHAPAT